MAVIPDIGNDISRYAEDFLRGFFDSVNTRSFTGLQALDNVWKGVRITSQDNVDAPTQAALPTSLPGPLPSQDLAATMDLTDIDLVFGLAIKKGRDFHPQGVYGFDFESTSLKQLLDANWEFQGASTDGKSLLVSKDSDLYLVQGNSTSS